MTFQTGFLDKEGSDIPVKMIISDMINHGKLTYFFCLKTYKGFLFKFVRGVFRIYKLEACDMKPVESFLLGVF